MENVGNVSGGSGLGDGGLRVHKITISSGDVNIAADVRGGRDIRTVLFLHAGGENRSVWHLISRAVCQQGWRTIAIDLRGHGESGRASHYYLNDFIADVMRVHDELCTAPLVIVGGSIGGALALIVAGEGTVPVAGLVLLDTPTRPLPEKGLDERNRLATAQSRGAAALRSVDSTLLKGSFVEEVVADIERWHRAALRIHVPVLLIAGKDSTIIGQQEIEATKDDLPQLEVVWVPAGHLVARDCPIEVAEHVNRFLSARSW